MTLPRRVVPGTTYLLTRRCTQRRFMLVPRGVTPKLFGYCVALAAERHRIELHAVMCMSNHWHAVLTDPEGRVCEFARDVHSLTARALNAHFGRWESLWSSQRLSLVELTDAEDVWDKLVYTAANPVQAGLVARSAEWPGLCTRPLDIDRVPHVFRRPRTRFFERSGLPEKATLTLAVPPQLSESTPTHFAREFSRRLGEREAAIRTRVREAGGTFMGARNVTRQRRDTQPKTGEARRRRDPAIASRHRARRLAMLDELRRFRDDYREARVRWLAGQSNVVFPRGTYGMRDYPGVMSDRAPPTVRQAA